MHDADVDLGLTSLPATTRRNFLTLVFPAVTRTAHARIVVLAQNSTLTLLTLQSLLTFFIVLSTIIFKSEFLGPIKNNFGTSVYLALIIMSHYVRSSRQYNAKDVNT